MSQHVILPPPLAALQEIGAEIEQKRDSPQELWTTLRGYMVASSGLCRSGDSPFAKNTGGIL